jgi:hypothetical protein
MLHSGFQINISIRKLRRLQPLQVALRYGIPGRPRFTSTQNTGQARSCTRPNRSEDEPPDTDVQRTEGIDPTAGWRYRLKPVSRSVRQGLCADGAVLLEFEESICLFYPNYFQNAPLPMLDLLKGRDCLASFTTYC